MRNITRILCPVDLSDVTQSTLTHAATLARWYGSAVTVLHVANPVTVPSADFAVVGVAGLPPTLTDQEFADARTEVRSYTDVAGVEHADVLVQSGGVETAILETARSLPADLIVIGTHGASGFAHLVLGSVTEKILRQAPCPVMTVPPRARSASQLPYKRILCPTDFSESSLSALEFAFSLAHESDAALSIVHVFDWPEEPLTTRPIQIPEYRRELEAGALARLHSLVPAGEREFDGPTTRLAHGKPYREILAIALEDRADLIVMGVHGRNPLDMMLFGSTTNQVVRRATCPVLTIRH